MKEEYLKQAEIFQNCLGIVMILLGIGIVIYSGIGEGLLFSAAGLHVIFTRYIVVPLPREDEE